MLNSDGIICGCDLGNMQSTNTIRPSLVDVVNFKPKVYKCYLTRSRIISFVFQSIYVTAKTKHICSFNLK